MTVDLARPHGSKACSRTGRRHQRSTGIVGLHHRRTRGSAGCGGAHYIGSELPESVQSAWDRAVQPGPIRSSGWSTTSAGTNSCAVSGYPGRRRSRGP